MVQEAIAPTVNTTSPLETPPSLTQQASPNIEDDLVLHGNGVEASEALSPSVEYRKYWVAATLVCHLSFRCQLVLPLRLLVPADSWITGSPHSHGGL
jgi:hypothetical protein